MIVALTGFMGCGKSTFGRKAADTLGWSFYDLDKEIVRQFGPIQRIFAIHGESYFRERETIVLRQLLESAGNTIIALGGGTIIQPENRLMLKEKATTIWIKAPVSLMLYEISLNRKRPLIKGRSNDQIIELYNSRVPMYQEVAYAIMEVDDTDSDSNAIELSAKINLLCS